MEIIIEHKIISAESNKISDQINECLAKGWHLYGQLYCNPHWGNSHYQAMVKYKTPLKSKK